LVGSDYTLGIENVGVVKAMEILQEFEGTGIEKLKKIKYFKNFVNITFFPYPNVF
jgi:5'-3' exonuclease